MRDTPDKFRHYFRVVAIFHVAFVLTFALGSFVRQWFQRIRKPEVITMIELFQPALPEPPAVETPAPAAVEPPPPAPTPTPPPPPPPRPQIQRSTERVRRDQPPPPPPALTPEQIRQQLEQAVPAGRRAPAGASDSVMAYYRLIHETLYRAWNQPGSVLSGTRAEARIRVQRDGTITVRELTRRSGNTTMDESVQSALQSVQRLAPLPQEISGPYHDFTIEFELTSGL